MHYKSLVDFKTLSNIIAACKQNIFNRRPKSNEFWIFHHGECGDHPSWTRWTTCLPNVLKSRISKENFKNTRYFYITYLRDPFDRYLSDINQIKRRANRLWIERKYECKNKTFVRYKSACHEGPAWTNFTFSNFLACPYMYNLAFNRETRMHSKNRCVL